MTAQKSLVMNVGVRSRNTPPATTLPEIVSA
jgi:hypothetical protein